MRIALISAEFSGTVHAGGIGTYMRNVANMLVARDHQVEVFAAGAETASEIRPDGLRLNIVRCGVRGDFPQLIAPVFLSRHRAEPFDVAEGAEFLAETSEVARGAPELPLVLKLHTPGVLISMIDAEVLPLSAKARFILGGLRRGKLVSPYWRYNAATDYERDNMRTASATTAPCHAIVRTVGALWGIEPNDISVIPNVFVGSEALLLVPIETRTKAISFIGRLETRKGVLDLADAIPLVLREVKDARFRLVGRSMTYPGTGEEIGAMLRRRLNPVSHAVEFIDSVPHDQVHQFYATSDICVLPSIWENFPNVCLEAMAAGRGVVGSSAGGMAEMIEDGRTGLLVPPRDPRAIANAIISMLRDPVRREEMGRAARAHVLKTYSPDVIAPLQEESYLSAIKRARARADLKRPGARARDSSTSI